MRLSWELNEETGHQPTFSITHETIDYYIWGRDGLDHESGMAGWGFPDLVIRWAMGGGFLGNIKEGLKVHKLLSVIHSDVYKWTRLSVEKILEDMPVSVKLHHEHGPMWNTLMLFNRAESGGIWIHLHKPFFSDFDYFDTCESGEQPYVDSLQEARLLVIEKGSKPIEKKDNEAIVFATKSQLKVLLDLSIAISKLPSLRF